MAANQVLAMDAKNLLDAVDKARFYKLEHATPPSPVEEATSSGAPSTSTPPSPNTEEGWRYHPHWLNY